MSALNDVLDCIDKQREASVTRLFELLKIKSISTDPAYSQDCIDAADWLVNELESLGITASRRDTPGHPMVVAHSEKISGQPNILFYGHYDVNRLIPWNCGIVIHLIHV